MSSNLVPSDPLTEAHREISRLRGALAVAERAADVIAERAETAEKALHESLARGRALSEALDESRRALAEVERGRDAALRSATDATEVVRDAHGESARLRGYAAGWLYIVEDSLKKDAAGQTFGLRLLRDQMRRALAGQQALIKEAPRPSPLEPGGGGQ